MTDNEIPVKTHLIDRNDLTTLRPLAWLILGMIIVWAIFFWTLPIWASVTMAVILGVATSYVVGYEIREAIRRRREQNQDRDDHEGGPNDAGQC